jgi:hypothetical protein
MKRELLRSHDEEVEICVYCVVYISIAADTLGLTAHDDSDLAVRALGACVWYLKDSFLDQQLLSMGRFEHYQPQDILEAKWPAENAGCKPAFSKHMASVGKTTVLSYTEKR